MVERYWPFPTLQHVRRLTDDCGIIQHAKFWLPDYATGYCVDDNSRALIVTYLYYQLFHEEDVQELAIRYLAFLFYMQQPDGGMRNFIDYSRAFLDHTGSPDSLGRTIWGLGYASTFEEYHLAIPAREMFHHALQHVTPHSPPHTQAYSLLGLCAYGELPILREDACKILRPRAEIFLQEFHANSTQDWPWFMPVLTYANARLPHALLHAGQLLQNNALLDAGVTALNHLNDVCFQYEYLSLVGCNGWYPRGGDCAEFDQQPIDAGAMVEANLVAYDITKQQQYFDFAIRAMDWFYGNNIVKTPLYDARSGGCHDGINVAGINANEGAESTLVYLMAQLQLYRVAPNLFTMTMPELSSTAFI